MAAPLAKSMKRLESRKSHSWWWDSHVSPKNSKWLSDNLEEMDKSVKRMLTLIEEDGDSFAKKAEMYYQKRPELIAHVEELYRMYRSLAERYDHVTGELRKNIPSDLQSQCSGVSDITSEVNSICVSPEHKSSRRRSVNRAAGFDFFLGSGGNNNDNFSKDGEESFSLTDSESESECSSVNNYIHFGNGGGDQAFQRKVIELEIELKDVKERLRMQQGENVDHSFSRIVDHEHGLRNANEKIQDSEEDLTRLRIELQKLDVNQATEFQDRQDVFEEAVKPDNKIEALVKEMKMTKDRLKDSENEINSLKDELERNRSSEKINKLQDQLQLAQKEVATWKAKLNSEKREVSKLQERISMLKISLSDRDHEIKDETRKIKDEKAELEERLNAEIRQLKMEVFERSNTIETLNKNIDALRTERYELNSLVVNLKAEVSNRIDQIDQMHKQLQELGTERVEMIAGAERTAKLVEELKLRTRDLEDEVERQRVAILEGAERKREVIRQLCFSLEHYRDGYHMLRKACMGNKRVLALKTNLVV